MSTPDFVAGLTRLFGQLGVGPAAATDALRSQLPDLRPGEKIPVYVLTNLPNGRFHVLVKDQLLDLNLPRNTQPGERLELTVVRNDGRLVFSLPAEANAAPKTAVSLSATAQLLQETLQRTQTRDPARVSGTMPLSQGAPDPARLAENLRGAVQGSGLFYESHQQQWVQGLKPLADLLLEPQARLNAESGLSEARAAALGDGDLPEVLRALQRSGAPESGAVLERLRAGEGADAGDRLQRRLEATGAVPAGAPALLAAAPDDKTAPAAAADLARALAKPDMQQLVQQQLQALETHRLLWQGEVWNDQRMDWEIVGRREDEPGADDSGAPTRWTTRLALDLPHLGRVVARLQLHQGQVNLTFVAQEQETARAMRHNQGRLISQFADARLALTGTQIAQGAEDDGG